MRPVHPFAEVAERVPLRLDLPADQQQAKQKGCGCMAAASSG